MRISIFGLGYVGCVSLGCLAQNGFEVIGIDVNPAKVDLINKGLPTIIEKDIDRIIGEQYQKGNIWATTDYLEAVHESDISIICVGTPSTESGNLNLDHIHQTALQIGEALKNKQKPFHIVVIRSTVIPGTNQRVGDLIESISGLKRNQDFAVVSNPEFLREGSAVADYYKPPFTLVGTDNDKAADVMRDIYAKVEGNFVRTDIKSAEIIKYVNNSYHALKVTFANEIGNICKKVGIDSHEVMRLFCMDRQLNISPYYFKPGFAYGGSCLPKDLKALKTMASEKNLDTPVLQAIESSNQEHIKMACKMIKAKGKKRIGILGVAFKEGTDDLRYSPILEVIESLVDSGMQVKAHDACVNEALLIGANRDHIQKTIPLLPNLLVQSEDEVLNWAEIVVINRKSGKYTGIVSANPGIQFIDLVRTVEDIQQPNYEGICW
jgi:GDP-mannose 6-dehydrogenase